MTPKHLSTERLLALYHEDLGDFDGLEHLASCPDCRRAFDDSRWARLLGRLPALVAASPHISQDEIEGYHTHALPVHRIAALERHLRACRECLARAGRMREIEQRGQYRSPSPATVRATLSRFRPRPLRRLGTVVIQAIENGVRLLLEPAPSSPHPSAASGRAGRIGRGIAAAPDMESFACISSLEFNRTSDHVADSPPDPPLIVPADDFTLILTSRSEQGDRRLQLQLVSEDPDRCIAGVRIRLRHDRADRSIKAETDAKGRATLPLPHDVKELIVELDPALSLRFRHDN